MQEIFQFTSLTGQEFIQHLWRDWCLGPDHIWSSNSQDYPQRVAQRGGTWQLDTAYFATLHLRSTALTKPWQCGLDLRLPVESSAISTLLTFIWERFPTHSKLCCFTQLCLPFLSKSWIMNPYFPGILLLSQYVSASQLSLFFFTFWLSCSASLDYSSTRNILLLGRSVLFQKYFCIFLILVLFLYMCTDNFFWNIFVTCTSPVITSIDWPFLLHWNLQNLVLLILCWAVTYYHEIHKFCFLLKKATAQN